jgi:hypothetical protein
MARIRLAIQDKAYVRDLQRLLCRSGAWDVELVEHPASGHDDVMVVDEAALQCLPTPLRNPERIVLLTRNDPFSLSQAWDAGIAYVVFYEDSLNTAMLAIMAAALRVPRAPASSVISPNGERTAACRSAEGGLLVEKHEG